MSKERHSNRPSTNLVMPSSAENSRERVKRWKKENPEKYKEQKKRYKKINAKANYQQVKTWRQENAEKHLLKKQRERWTKRMLECSRETEVLPIIKFDCDETIASEQLQQDFEDSCEVIASEQEQDLVANFDLSLLEV